MLADPEVAVPSVADPVRATKAIEVVAVVHSRALPIARLIIGATGVERPSHQQQRHHAKRLLEQLLNLTYPGRSSSWVLSHHASGAPYLERGDDPDPQICVSISHAGCLAAAAISTAAGVGTDIENERSGRDTSALAKFMGWRLCGNVDADFYRRWTLWEAYTKCREGLLFEPAGPEFEGLYADSDRYDDGNPRTWHGRYLQEINEFHAAMVVRTSIPVVAAVRSLDLKATPPW